MGSTWHKSCFCCGGIGNLGCHRTLSSTGYEPHGGIGYCIACYAARVKADSFPPLDANEIHVTFDPEEVSLGLREEVFHSVVIAFAV